MLFSTCKANSKNSNKNIIFLNYLRIDKMKLKAISSSVLLALLPVSGVYAAAMDRSGQSISAFLQPNNYFEGGISILDP